MNWRRDVGAKRLSRLCLPADRVQTLRRDGYDKAAWQRE